MWAQASHSVPEPQGLVPQLSWAMPPSQGSTIHFSSPRLALFSRAPFEVLTA